MATFGLVGLAIKGGVGQLQSYAKQGWSSATWDKTVIRSCNVNDYCGPIRDIRLGLKFCLAGQSCISNLVSKFLQQAVIAMP